MAAGAGAVDGGPVGVQDGGPAGVEDGDPAGELGGARAGEDLAGDGAAPGAGVDRASLWRLDFTAEVASFDVSSPARGVRVGF